MRLLVDGGGYATARTAFSDANQVAAMQYESLTGKLAAYDGMAGDDAASADFAAAYDEAAAQAVSGLADIVHATASLGHLTDAALVNHRGANLASIIGGASVDGAATDGNYAAVTPATPPSAVGGSSPPLPFPVGLLVDSIDGFVWPNADADRLRDAAHTWRCAAESLDGLRGYYDAAIRGLEGQHSPEIPLALDAITELATITSSVADQYAVLASSCETFAATVEEKRREIVALGLEVLRVIAEEVALTIALGVVTAGAGAVGKGALAGARIAAYAPRFAAIITALRTTAATTATTVRSCTTVLRSARSQLDKYVKVMTHRSAVRGEVGSIGPLGRWKTWLGPHERYGSHTLVTHVGKRDEEILERLVSNPRLRMSSTFTDERTAANAIGEVLSRQRHVVDDWLRHGEGKLEIDADAGEIVGRFARQGSMQITESSTLRAVLVQDPRMPEGWRLLTAFVTG